MADYVDWDPGVTVGVEEIDLEHRTFVALINRLESVKTDRALAPRVLQELIKYVAFHFQSEENIFFENGYPELEAHRVLHLALLEKLNIVLMELRSGQIDFDELLAFFREWYLNHTAKEDRRFAAFLAHTAEASTADEQRTPTATRSPTAPGSPPPLTRVPTAWLHDMLAASVRLHSDRVLELAAALQAADATVADWASARAADFDYPEIAAALRSELARRASEPR